MMSSLFLHLLGLGQQKAQYPSQEAITQPFHLYFHHTLGLQRPSYFYLEDYFPNIPRLSPFRLYFQLAFIWGLIRSFPSSKKHLLIRQARQARWQGKEVDTIKNFWPIFPNYIWRLIRSFSPSKKHKTGKVARLGSVGSRHNKELPSQLHCCSIFIAAPKPAQLARLSYYNEKFRI